MQRRPFVFGRGSGATAYQTGQTAYSAGPGSYAAQRAGSAFDTTYHSTAAQQSSNFATASSVNSSSYDYAYARTAGAYDGTKAYYQQTAINPTYATTESNFQVSKSNFNANAIFGGIGGRGGGGTLSGKAFTTYPIQASQNYSPFNPIVAKGLLKNPGTSMYNSQGSISSNISKPLIGNGNWQQFRRGNIQNRPKSKSVPKPQQLHYCDICKISCAGPQTYREHLDGQKHKKKEAALKTGITVNTSRGGSSLRCELCDVTCTGSDAYAAHIRGAKHQKVVKLHTKLGKPIPSSEPIVIPANNKVVEETENSHAEEKLIAPSPKINFVDNVKLETETPVLSNVNNMASSFTIEDIASSAFNMPGINEIDSSLPLKDEKYDEQKFISDKSPPNISNEVSKSDEKDIQPVGQDYIEEIRNEDDKIISFNCKLCECRFNDPNAKEMHMKGRRHRLQYKKKVNPDLIVEIKPSLRQRKLQEEKLRRQAFREEIWRYPGPPQPPTRPFPPTPLLGPPLLRRPDTSDDRHVIAKHGEIYPKDADLTAVQTIVSNTEKALKLVSDHLTEISGYLNDGDIERILKGVMRVGILAKGLLLHGDKEVELVVLCSEKPTLTLLEQVSANLPMQLKVIAPELDYDVILQSSIAAVLVCSHAEPEVTVIVTLTSPVIREQNSSLDGSCSTDIVESFDLLNRHSCLKALASLRHAKWFQARANGLQSCVMIVRILRDFCQRAPCLSSLNTWSLELLCERIIASAGQPLSPGDALRRVFEAIASGLLLTSGPGLQDPCEKELTDALSYLTNQQREDITSSAQLTLRLIAFRQIHKVLGMEPLPSLKFGRSRFQRKRRRDSLGAEDNDVKEKSDGEHNSFKQYLCFYVTETCVKKEKVKIEECIDTQQMKIEKDNQDNVHMFSDVKDVQNDSAQIDNSYVKEEQFESFIPECKKEVEDIISVA